MDGPTRRRHGSRRRSWCCTFNVPPSSPENPHNNNSNCKTKLGQQKADSLSKLTTSNSVLNSPQSSKSGLTLVGRIDPRRILSPGRVSPIDHTDSFEEDHNSSRGTPSASAAIDSMPRSRSRSFRAKIESPDTHTGLDPDRVEGGRGGAYDVRLNLKGKNGGVLVLELNSGVLASNSEVFAGLIAGSLGKKMCRIEVPEVENLGVFRETIELMFEEGIAKRLVKIGVYRAIDILEVSASIMFSRGVLSCLKYLEVVPWTEEEEEKLRSLFTRFRFDDGTSRDILARLYSQQSTDTHQNLARHLVSSITTCCDANARNELKSLVKGLLCKSSVYEEQPDVNKEDLYAVCQSCVTVLVNLFVEASDAIPHEIMTKEEMGKPLIERISRQVDNINWLLEILLDQQMAEEFVDRWAHQGNLLKMHERASPMVRYELSRVSAILFIAMGTRKLHCCSEARLALLQAWFGPMLLDFGWLQRCRKGLDMKALEEALGQTLLTLPLKQQYVLFMEWFRCFSKHGTECPNLSKAFQIWWRRSFLRGSETYAVESR